MTLLDRYIDEFELAIDRRGVQAVDPREFAPSDMENYPVHLSRAIVVTEMLRVWMEHRWSAGISTSTQECLGLFPDVRFTNLDIAELEKEETRQRAQYSSSRETKERHDELHSTQPPFPNKGETWCGFELISILGTGAIARVYLAKQPDLAGRLVALKLTYRESFESHWLATLQHSAIVPIFSTHFEGNLYGICMPYLGNTTLQDVIHSPWYRNSADRKQWWRNNKRSDDVELSPIASTVRIRNSKVDTLLTSTKEATAENDQESSLSTADPLRKSRALYQSRLNQPYSSHERLVLEIGLKIAEALAHAHRFGVIHSDIKPANVLLSNEGEPRLIDFNVSYRHKSADHKVTEPLGGTLPYMSPELKSAMRDSDEARPIVDHRTDIFSLGMVMIQLLCGQLHSERELFDWTSKHKWTSSASPALFAILKKCVADRAANRYATAEQLCDDLRAQLESRPLVHTREPSFVERMFKWSHRHPRIASGATSLLVSLVVIVSLGLAIVNTKTSLERANWNIRVSQLETELPNSLSLITSLDLAPELEWAAAESLNKTIGIASSLSDLKPYRTSQNTNLLLGNDRISNDTQSQWKQLLFFAKSREWSQSPTGLATVPQEEWEMVTSIDGASHASLFKSVQSGNYLAAISSLRAHISSNPRDYFSWWLLGDCYVAIQDWSQAEQAYTVCTLLRPEIAVVYFNRGITRFSQQRFADADMDYAHTYQLSPQWHTCLLNRALCLQALGQMHAALNQLEAAIQSGYRTVSVFRLQSVLFEQVGEIDASRLAIRNALEESPTTEAQWIDRGLIELNEAPDRAVASFQKALLLNPQSVDAHQKLAYVHSELLADLDTSLIHLDALLTLSPKIQSHRAGRAVILARLGNQQESMNDVTELEKESALDSLVEYQMACVYSLLGRHASQRKAPDDLQSNITDGMKWLRKATLADPSFIDVANGDPDLEWLRETPDYAKWIELVSSFRTEIPRPHSID